MPRRTSSGNSIVRLVQLTEPGHAGFCVLPWQLTRRWMKEYNLPAGYARSLFYDR